MLNDLSRRYLQELRTAQQNIDSSSLKEETQDGTDHEVLETHTSEYDLELGPLKLKVKKSKTVTGKSSVLKKSTQSIDKGALSANDNSYTKDQLDQMRNLQAPEPENSTAIKRINFTI